MEITEKKDSKSKRKIIIICAVAIGILATVNIVLLILLLQSGGGPGSHGAVNVRIIENPAVISSRLEESQIPSFRRCWNSSAVSGKKGKSRRPKVRSPQRLL